MTGFTIAPIGTCRIHTPLRDGARRYPFTLELGRNYGFVHSAQEALQQYEVMTGGASVADDIAKLMCRPTISAAVYRKPHVPADLYMVEISSRKDWTVDGTPVQSNYAARYFGDFFTDKERARRFWSMATDHHDAERRAWLQSEPVFARMPTEDRELLARLRKRELDDAEIEPIMAEIVARIGKDRVVFVTHVNAMLPDDRPMESRQRLIAVVRAVAKRLDVPCYDPTALMREIGQIDAMERNGLDLTHYTTAFSQRLSADWYKRFIAGRIGGAMLPDIAAPSDASSPPEITTIEEMWAAGQVLPASRLVRDLLRHDPALGEHRLVLGRMQCELGDYEGAVITLERVYDEFGPTDEIGTLLMRAYFRIGDYRNARKFATALLSDEVETAEVLRISAISATRLGATDAAVADWMRLFRMSEDKIEAAASVLQLLQDADENDRAAAWASEVLAVMPDHMPSFVARWIYLLDRGDRDGLIILARQAMALDEAEGLALADRTAAAGFATPAALLVARCGLRTSESEAVVAWIAHQTTEWMRIGIEALAEGPLLLAADTLQARWQLKPSGNQLIRAQRALEQQFRRETRQAFIEKRFVDVVALTDIARQTLIEFPEMNSFLGRALDALGKPHAALEPLKRAAQEEDASLATKVQLARVAVRSEDYLAALAAYSDVAAHEPNEEWAQSEARRQLLSLEGRSIRAARLLVADNLFDRAWSLLSRLEQSNPGNLAVRREKTRVLASLRAQVKTLDPNASDERLQLGEAILRLDPSDEVGLKIAAVGAMRMHHFDVALAHWKTLRSRSIDTTQIDSNIQKCLLWIDRARRKAAA